MVALADAKRVLNLTGNDDDALIEGLIIVATDYLSKIGVLVDPEPAPVGEAVLLLVSRFYDRRSERRNLKYEQIDGVRTFTNFDPKSLDDADLRVVDILTAPYREQGI
ncbi:head-tail connector protein [Rhizobium sp.]|jgi:hypothetical protein|uniref:head-tail connector protein n=1 Tax=Rhizobium sp. TaxID=391 RepID=UPI000E9303A8|nr:hypothetical protein [Rhizobium sp.]